MPHVKEVGPMVTAPIHQRPPPAKPTWALVPLALGLYPRLDHAHLPSLVRHVMFSLGCYKVGMFIFNQLLKHFYN